MQDICNVRVLRSAECGYKLVRGTFKPSIWKKVCMNGIQVPKKIDVKKLRDAETKKEFNNKIKVVDLTEQWETFKTTVYEAGVETLGLVKKTHSDWFDDNNVEIQKLLQEKHELHKKLISSSFTMFLSRKLSLSSIVLWYKESCV